ncbi:type II toxin-antitoxin system Phd/YefM family antitoxin [Jiangella sp. DSM 45060]|uniref:type II toxin-antitoxin system Phd/YefM family antitoxin n=1 Tax=Jiangella sp. DSM 45060 TaxID=1798224 RepID=UPI00087DE3A3|nr:type II toxin-antitoxin system Phd/YefM family antitoxin [Jiangella sp. DSM 45060]SDT37032.1 hypothetical protein SAMN04515669_3753 [Jiangella sp. DSM 45060]
MAVPEIYTVSDARKNLPALIASVSAGRMPMIGAHRKPAAVLMHPSTLDVFTPLLDGLAEQVARELIDDQRRGDIAPGDPLHPGDPAGKVLAWLWLTGQHSRLTEHVASIVYYMRVKHARDDKPALRFSDLLAGIEFALPNDFPRDQVEQLLHVLRENLPGRFSHDVDEQ